jgi:hypothetical protein
VSTLQSLAQSPLAILAGLALGVVGLIATIRAQRVRRPVYAIREQRLVTAAVSALPGLAITFGGHPVENLTVTRIAFWNAGSETISKEDVPPLDPIRISATAPAEILDATVLTVTDAVNDCRLVQETGDFHVLFEYLDHQEGLLMQIIHTGATDKSISVSGRTKGAKSVRLVSPSQATPPPKGRVRQLLGRVAGVFGMLIGIVFPTGVIYLGIMLPWHGQPLGDLLLSYTLKIGIFWFGWYLYSAMWKHLNEPRVPVKLNDLWNVPQPPPAVTPK